MVFQDGSSVKSAYFCVWHKTVEKTLQTSAWSILPPLFEFAEYLARKKAFRLNLNCVLKTPFLKRVREYLHEYVGEDVFARCFKQVAHNVRRITLFCARSDYFGMTPACSTWQNYRINRAKQAIERECRWRCGIYVWL